MRFHKLRRDYTSGIGSPTTSTIVVLVCTGELSGSCHWGASTALLIPASQAVTDTIRSAFDTARLV
jgi:hypothetical protein